MPTTIQNASINIGGGSLSRIVIVADSHGRPHKGAFRWIQAEQPQAILHAGDIGGLAVIDELAAIAPTFAVRGNVDARDPRTPDNFVLDVIVGSDSITRILLTHIALRGPRLLKDARMRAKENGAQIVVCGHSHVPFMGEEDSLVVFNPGSLGPRRFRLPITFGVADFSPTGLALRHIDCETGARWTPSPFP